MKLQTEYEFELPLGLLDEDGTLHRRGTMRLSTAADEILPLRDPRVQANRDYLIIIVLARVITKLGSLVHVNPGVIEKLYLPDMTYLVELYNNCNKNGKAALPTVCPKCAYQFSAEMSASGGF
jgi:hypothetical protein